MSTQKKILVVAESIDVEDSSGTKGRVALIRNLHKSGFEVRVYHYTRKEIQLKGIACVAIKEKRWSALFFLSRLERYMRVYFKISLSKPLEKVFGFSFTLFNDRNSIIAALEKIEDFNPDLVLTLSKGGSFRPHHALLKMPNLHKKWIAYIHDPYPMHLYPRPYNWVEAGYHKKWRFMKNVSEKAAFTAFPSKLLMEWMGSYFKGYIEKGMVIPHQISSDEIPKSTIPDYFDSEKFSILHAGNLLWGRDPEGLIQGFIQFLKLNPEAEKDSQLLFLGGQNHYSSILSEWKNKIPQFYVSEDYVPFSQVQTLQKRCAVNVILEAKSEISPFLPGKFPHCVMADKPILLLGPYYSESRRLLGEDYSYWAEIDKADLISGILKDLYSQWKKDPLKLKLNRPDLEEYLSVNYLSNLIYKTL
ncbi:UDP-glycosyltransferase [Gillisia sp. Q332]|uniref:UDP-glycosyltransferase n=1 Tax=Gillisia xinjiangensis TaxID=3384765 RepID=UPI0039195E43